MNFFYNWYSTNLPLSSAIHGCDPNFAHGVAPGIDSELAARQVLQVFQVDLEKFRAQVVDREGL